MWGRDFEAVFPSPPPVNSQVIKCRMRRPAKLTFRTALGVKGGWGARSNLYAPTTSRGGICADFPAGAVTLRDAAPPSRCQVSARFLSLSGRDYVIIEVHPIRRFEVREHPSVHQLQGIGLKLR